MTDAELELLIDQHRDHLRTDVPREVLVDFLSQVQIAAAQSKRTVVKDRQAVQADEICLAPHRANKVAGLIRHEYVDEIFSEIATRHGGERMGKIEVPIGEKIESRPLFLSTYRFGGTLLGFGSHFERQDLPRLNKTRRALCLLNDGLIPDLFLKPRPFTDNDRFAVLLLQRSPHDIGSYSSVTIALLDGRGAQFVFQDELSDFVAGYGSVKQRGGRRSIALRPRKQVASS